MSNITSYPPKANEILIRCKNCDRCIVGCFNGQDLKQYLCMDIVDCHGYVHVQPDFFCSSGVNRDGDSGYAHRNSERANRHVDGNAMVHCKDCMYYYDMAMTGPGRCGWAEATYCMDEVTCDPEGYCGWGMTTEEYEKLKGGC